MTGKSKKYFNSIDFENTANSGLPDLIDIAVFKKFMGNNH